VKTVSPADYNTFASSVIVHFTSYA